MVGMEGRRSGGCIVSQRTCISRVNIESHPLSSSAYSSAYLARFASLSFPASAVPPVSALSSPSTSIVSAATSGAASTCASSICTLSVRFTHSPSPSSAAPRPVGVTADPPFMAVSTLAKSSSEMALFELAEPVGEDGMEVERGRLPVNKEKLSEGACCREGVGDVVAVLVSG